MRNMIIRALRTFLQAALGYIVANVAAVFMGADENTAKTVALSLLCAAVAAGLAAVMNLPKTNGQISTVDEIGDNKTIGEVPDEELKGEI